MGRIRVLDDRLVNRIAAGEVIERPASVVRELIENSLDAGARSVRVEIASGGKRLVRVADDGQGMDREDALLSLERHATSKLQSPGDLHAIRTLGFRGEALPSIAAVSRFLLKTAPADGAGTEVEARGGTIRAVRDVGLPRGTAVEVGSLFFNLPARRKFLRSDSTELSHVVRCVSRYALVHPGIRFHLEHGGRILLEAPPVDGPGDRLRQIFGRELASRLLPLRFEAGPLVVRGFAGRPVDASGRRDAQHLFVNGRHVQDRLLAHAVREAYGNTIPRDRQPSVFLVLEIDPAQVDVNVHPQKLEVRFSRANEVHDGVREAIRRALGNAAAVPTLGQLRPERAEGGPVSPVASSTLAYLERQASASAGRGLAVAETGGGGRDRPAPPARPEPDASASMLDAEAADTGRDRVPLAQFRDSYIVAEDREGLVLVDQHAAHERVLFERYLRDAESDRVEVQKLLFPATVELTPDETALLEEERDEFRRLGFVLEPFGGTTFRLEAVPAIVGEHDPVVLLRELLGEARRTRSASTGVPELRRKLVTSAACQAAIKVNHPLGMPAMQRLLDDLSRTVSPTTCPHGRPVLFRLSLDEIERAFRRR